MNPNYENIFKYLVLPKPSPEVVRLVIFIVVLFIAMLILLEVTRTYLARRKERASLLKAVNTHDLSEEEKDLILNLAAQRQKINPELIFGSIREFHRLFGPMMHELADRAGSDSVSRRKLEKLYALRQKLFGEVHYHFGNVTSTIQLKIGQKISMEFIYEGRSITASSMILDVDSAAITVANTTQKGDFIYFKKGHQFNVSFYRENDGYYQFRTLAVRDIEKKSPLFLLLSHADMVQRIQSRKFYRMPVSLPLNFRHYPWDDNLETRYIKGLDEVMGEKTGMIMDISAGGIRFQTEENLNKNDMLLLDLNLSSELTFPDLMSKVVNVQSKTTEKGFNTVHIQFLNIKPGEQDLIVRMIQQHKFKEED